MPKPRVYLAGPMIFARDPEIFFGPMKRICAEVGLDGVSPLDNQIALEGVAAGEDLNRAIYLADENLMRTLDAAILCLDPFRGGTEMDPGTAYETGFLKALGKPMTGWTQCPETYAEKVRTWSRDVFQAELNAEPVAKGGATSGLLRDKDGVMVHSDGCVQNLMVVEGIRHGGGEVFAHDDWQTAFSHAAQALAQRLIS
jgi:nucleoside 2-deoxyribosyltransferase